MKLTARRSLAVEPNLPAALEPLRGLARNLFWTWNTDEVVDMVVSRVKVPE